MMPSFSGGSDLRAYSSWRLRDRNSLLLQGEWRASVNRFLEMALFYDAGTVGRTFGDLSFAHLRQDGGLGATFRVRGVDVAQTYIAWGAGHGPTLGYSFTKLF